MRAGPENYRSILHTLAAGDTLALEPGEYRSGLPIQGLIGTADRSIVIAGPAEPGRAVFVARAAANTVSIVDCAHVMLRNLVLDGRGLRVDAVKAEGHAHWAHHITLERLTIVGHGADQQTVGISTKCPAWGWTVRGCTITGAGTAMYFGNSDGSAPFFASLIEGNRVIDPIGYALQVKHQQPRPSLQNMPTGSAVAVVRGNVLVKSEGGASGELARPNMLVGHWPLQGAGARDAHLIYGNLFFGNPHEALFQGEGNFALYNNIFFNPHGDAIRIHPHNDKPRKVAVFCNTVIASGLGVEFVGGEPGYESHLEHNLVFANPPLRSEVGGDNRLGTYEQARAHFVELGSTLDELDASPLTDGDRAASRLSAKLLALPGARRDFLGRTKAIRTSGACAPRAGPDVRRCAMPASLAILR